MAPPTFNGKWEHGVEGITKIVQRTGDLLWLPPGWYHEVLTVKGEEHSFDIASNTIAVHFVFFWMTEDPAVHKDAALAYLGGLVEEAQTKVSGPLDKGKRRQFVSSILCDPSE